MAVLVNALVQVGAQTKTTDLTNQGTVSRSVTGAVFVLNVTAAATLVTDTLNVYVQSSADDGTTWDDFVSFTQVLGNGGVKKFLAFWNGVTTPGTAVRPPTDGTLAVSTVNQGPVGGRWRVKSVTVGTGSFTYSLDVGYIRNA